MCQSPHVMVTGGRKAGNPSDVACTGARIRGNLRAMHPILQTSLGYDPSRHRPLPGIAPLDPQDWIIVDDAHAAQMAERARLLTERPEAVLALDPPAMPAALELLETVLSELAARGDHAVASDRVTRPDGVTVPLRRDDPMATLGHLVQQDLCLMEKRGDEHVLMGAVLCFPASWTLSEKFLRPLIGIHVPVDVYDADLARRVQRLFDGVQLGRPLWRFNALWYADPTLHQPRREADRRPERGAEEAPYLRTERQSLVRLPDTGAVVFGIHTSVLHRDRVRALWPDRSV
jgi:dimethylamine monooxygenase subunit A